MEEGKRREGEIVSKCSLREIWGFQKVLSYITGSQAIRVDISWTSFALMPQKPAELTQEKLQERGERKEILENFLKVSSLQILNF